MGIFSLFSKSDKTRQQHEVKEKDYTLILGSALFKEIADKHAPMVLYYLKGQGFIGANELFLKTMGLYDIAQFKRKYESVRDMFVYESEEIFTESDKSWMDYIKKYKPDGYRLHLINSEGSVMAVDAKCSVASYNAHIYILELKDVSEIEQSRDKIKEVEKLKSRFLANIGHEFRTPMNGILGFLELLSQSNLDSKQQEYIEMIANSSKSLMLNIESLLELSQLQGGRLGVESVAFNLLVLVEKLCYDFFIQGERKGVKVLSFIDPKLPLEIIGDSQKVRQILYSLTHNAIKFTPRGGRVTLEVKLLKRYQNGDCSIGFGVKDTGSGISPEQISLIHEPFTAGNHADERLGVGLSLSHGLVNLLGSELKIQAKMGEGSYLNFVLDIKGSKGQNYKMMPKKKVKVLLLDQSRVDDANLIATYLRSFAIDVIKSSQLDESLYEDIEELYVVANQNDSSWMLELGTFAKKVPITLLLDQDEKLQTRLTHIVDGVLEKPFLPSKVASYLSRNAKKSFSPKNQIENKIKESAKVLVVEDNLINQRLIQIMLQESQLSVSTAANGIEAVEMCEESRYDLIFMDIDLPQKNGIVATKEIKNRLTLNQSTPIVALTAMAMQGDREMLLGEGLDEYIAKPLTRIKLQEVLDKYLSVKV